MSLRAQAEAAITEITGQPPVSVRQVSSGDAAAGAFVAQLPDGTPVFAKASRLERAAQAEAASLTWLAEPGALAVPRVHGHDDHWLVIDFIEPGAPTPQAAEEFGLQQMVAVISDSGAAGSIALHEKLGFEEVGRMGKVGFKFDRWLGTVYLQKQLSPKKKPGVLKRIFG